MGVSGLQDLCTLLSSNGSSHRPPQTRVVHVVPPAEVVVSPGGFFRFGSLEDSLAGVAVRCTGVAPFPVVSPFGERSGYSWSLQFLVTQEVVCPGIWIGWLVPLDALKSVDTFSAVPLEVVRRVVGDTEEIVVPAARVAVGSLSDCNTFHAGYSSIGGKPYSRISKSIPPAEEVVVPSLISGLVKVQNSGASVAFRNSVVAPLEVFRPGR